MIGKVQSGLTGRVPGADQVDIEPVGGARFAARRSVVDTLADEPIEAIVRKTAPRHAGCKNYRPRPDGIAAIEEDLARFRVDSSDRARDQDLRPQTFCLLERATREFVARNPAREAQIVLDPRGSSGLTSRRLALDDHGAKSLGRTVHRRREPGRPATDDDGVVFGKTWASLKAKNAGKIA